MGILEDMEFSILGSGQYEPYQKIIAQEEMNGRQEYMDKIRYMMAISFNSERKKAAGKFMFIGGLAILGHLVSKFGPEVISSWRGTKDLDLLVKDTRYTSLAKECFDTIQIDAPSLSIPNKRTLIGASCDSENHSLCETQVDIFYPPKTPGIVPIDDVVIGEKEWNKKKGANFFGIQVYFLNILPLLDLKLHILNDGKKKRDQDIKDICHLVGLSEKEGYTPTQLKSYFSSESRENLAKAITGKYSCKVPCGGNVVFSPSREYRGELAR